MQGAYLDANVITVHGILQYRLRDDGDLRVRQTAGRAITAIGEP